MKPLIGLAAVACALVVARPDAVGGVFETTHAPEGREGELGVPATYRLWVPDGVERLRGLIVHQHGCGAVPQNESPTGVHDLHWQALATKWHVGLLIPSYHAGERDNCRRWCDPRQGSDQAFLAALGRLAAESKRPEVAEVPWALWGHSGGAFWASIMMHLHPRRTVAVWLRSGGAAMDWSRPGATRPPQSPEVFTIPVMSNPGLSESKNPSHRHAWDTSLIFTAEFRKHDAPAGFAPDPLSKHDCGESRYLAIPFFDHCFAARLPREPGGPLRPLDRNRDWLAPYAADGTLGEPVPARERSGPPEESVWLPDAEFARLWKGYVQTGIVPDETPPPRPTGLAASGDAAGSVTLTWRCAADLESGLSHFVVTRDGQPIATLARTPVGRFGRPIFQGLTHGDTPISPLPEMRFAVPPLPRSDAAATTPVRYGVEAFNLAGLGSGSAEAVFPSK